MKSPEAANTANEPLESGVSSSDSSNVAGVKEPIPSEIELEMQKLDIERKKLDIEADKLALEKSKDRTARRLGMFPTLISLFALLLTAFTTYQNTKLAYDQEWFRRNMEEQKLHYEFIENRDFELFKTLAEKAKDTDEAIRLYKEIYPKDDRFWKSSTTGR